MSAGKKGNQKVADHVWRLFAGHVTDMLEGWRRQMSEATGMPYSRVRLLRRLRDRPLTLREIAEATGTDAPATSLAVTDLEERGLVERGPHPEDRRAKLVALTAEGRAMVASAKKANDSVPEKFAALSEKDLADLERILGKLTT